MLNLRRLSLDFIGFVKELWRVDSLHVWPKLVPRITRTASMFQATLRISKKKTPKGNRRNNVRVNLRTLANYKIL